jgi:hypothetical protein
MRRSRIVGFLVFFLAGAARADMETVPQLRVTPGIGIGFLDLSLELNVEGPRWYAGAQLAAAWSGRGGLASYAGLRAGAFVTDRPAALFLGGGLGPLKKGGVDSNSSSGCGASAEVGVALRRKQSWFHPQIVLQIVLPFLQRSTSVYRAERAPVVMLGARLFL